MPRIEVAAADTPFGERLRTGFGYPLRGAGLATCVVLALIHYVGLLPSWIGALASAFVWAATWRYAADCMLHTANGYADPPNVGSDGNSASGWGLTAIHLLIVALCVLAIVFFPSLLWPVLILSALALPAIDMSLAFDGNLALALNPLNWGRVIAAFGAAYLVPVAINLLLGILIVLASLTSALLPRLLALPLFAFAYTYLIVLAFHLMGVMIHQRHERFGLEPEAPKLAKAGGQDADEILLAEVDALTQADPAAATALLVARMQDRVAPASLHLAYRRLLQQQNLRDGLLVHGQIWIAALIAQGESRRALGLLQECCGIDASFVPDDPRTCGELADLAARLGMSRIALHLCNGFLAHWPRDAQAPHYGLLAVRQLAEHADQHAEATALLDRLAAAWPEHPLRAEIDAQRRQLVGHA
ncbi:hypothetical protein GCM10008098_14800 [Rhodanobacter panaciterrae]|uniref:Uncharacterized protein n=1 Tax=Rhodanobacter panaciterrae TaxID=490572 RepID=A0ABQ2ZQK2_9GAMM|nr:hypothetical protein [Rhodanobacter panaciterrae]GGY22571.1 hypothetical protein GCM10008098_14800 [Rhodanobacter panaciterrae]